MAESSVIGLDYGGVSVLHKDPQNHSPEDTEVKSCAGQGHPQRTLERQEGHNPGEAVTSLPVWILSVWAWDTLLCI